MFSYHIQAELASERRKTLLTEAETARRVRDARSHRQRTGISPARTSPLGWRPGWLASRGVSWRRTPRYVADGNHVAGEPCSTQRPYGPEASKLIV